MKESFIPSAFSPSLLFAYLCRSIHMLKPDFPFYENRTAQKPARLLCRAGYHIK